MLSMKLVQKRVDRMHGSVFELGQGGPNKRLESPMLARIRIWLFVGNPQRPLINPATQKFDLLGFELLSFVFGRHAVARVGARDSLDDPTLGRLAW
jgi:hypothetical protein